MGMMTRMKWDIKQGTLGIRFCFVRDKAMSIHFVILGSSSHRGHWSGLADDIARTQVHEYPISLVRHYNRLFVFTNAFRFFPILSKLFTHPRSFFDAQSNIC